MFFKVIELFEDLDLRSDLFDFLMNIIELRISVVILGDEIFVVEVFVLFLTRFFLVLRSFLCVCAHYIFNQLKFIKYFINLLMKF